MILTHNPITKTVTLSDGKSSWTFTGNTLAQVKKLRASLLFMTPKKRLAYLGKPTNNPKA